MIRYSVARFTLTILALGACSQPPESIAGDEQDSAATIAEARARAQELASSSQNYQPVRFVSEIEQVKPPRPIRRPEPDVVVREGQEPVPAEAVPAPVVAPEVESPAVHVDSTTESVSAPRVPSIIPREAPMPVAVGGGSGDWRSPAPGPDMGTVIGVVLRGGRVDPGHCPRHPRPPSQIPNRIPR